MISVAALSGGAAAGYYAQARGCEHELAQELTASREPERLGAVGTTLAYYVNGHDLPGRWIGGGSRALGLDGAFTDADAGGGASATSADTRVLTPQVPLTCGNA